MARFSVMLSMWYHPVNCLLTYQAQCSRKICLAFIFFSLKNSLEMTEFPESGRKIQGTSFALTGTCQMEVHVFRH